MENRSGWWKTVVSGGSRRTLKPGVHTVRTRPRDHRLAVQEIQLFVTDKQATVESVRIADRNVLRHVGSILDHPELRRLGKGTILEPGEQVVVTVETRQPGMVMVFIPGLMPTTQSKQKQAS